MNEAPMKIGDKIKMKREEMGLSREHLAAVVDMDVRTYEKIENNKRDPNLSELDKIAGALKITSFELQYGEPKLVFQNCNQNASVYNSGTVNYQNPEIIKTVFEELIPVLKQIIILLNDKK